VATFFLLKVLKELAEMGLQDKPVVTLWNKIDLMPDRAEYFKLEASKRPQTIAVSAVTGEGISNLMPALETALASNMDYIGTTIPYNDGTTSLIDSLHNLGILDEVVYLEEGIYVRGKVPLFLRDHIISLTEPQDALDGDRGDEGLSDDYDWTQLARGRHEAVNAFDRLRSYSIRSERELTSAVSYSDLDTDETHNSLFSIDSDNSFDLDDGAVDWGQFNLLNEDEMQQ